MLTKVTQVESEFQRQIDCGNVTKKLRKCAKVDRGNATKAFEGCTMVLRNCFNDQEWVKWVCWYASSRVLDSWYEFIEDQLSWPKFMVAIAHLYPGSRKMDQQYSRNDLYSLVDSQARREIHTEEELMNYRLYFLDLTTFLWVLKQLEADELEDLYVQGFDKEFQREIIRKMRRDDRQ
ncbi:hypothetical protein M404DRAFT_23544 [Pisolithus tinctorius Marx 270]|uniref:Uncharacterized protein n=1 Tax=Pisolithus tinctorius Marx 270 TaxID=870435 RepID=A0A0C3JF19_PISTI|nr:hypothetical protein M404DRAFT_23544 [Pisolithus tinctorius Marx 270]